MPQLDFSTYAAQIVWLALIFSVLYLFIARFVAPSIDSIVARREATRGADLSRADAAQKNAAEAESAWKAALAEARTRASEALHRSAVSVKEQEAKHASTLAARIHAKEREADAQLKTLSQDIAASFPAIATELARDILKRIANKQVSDAEITSTLTLR